MADVAADLKTWSTTAASNSPAGTTTIGTGLDDNLREIQKVVRQDLAHKGADVASTATADVGAVAGLMHDITGTTTITGLGTVSAGIWKILKFEGALTLTHNATSLILLTGANRTTVAGDVGIYMSEGSGNWRELSYMPVNTQLTNSGVKFAASQAASSDANTLDDYEEGTYTPTWSLINSLGNGSIAGKYTKVGNLVTATITATIGGTTTFNAGAWTISLPFNSGAAPLANGIARAFDTGTNYRIGVVVVDSAGAANASVFHDTATSNWSDTSPFTWASGDELRITISYYV